VSSAGFKTVEILSSVALAARDFTPAFQGELTKALRPFSIVSVHGFTVPGEKSQRFAHPEETEQLLRRHVDIMSVAHDLGASLVNLPPVHAVQIRPDARGPL